MREIKYSLKGGEPVCDEACPSLLEHHTFEHDRVCSEVGKHVMPGETDCIPGLCQQRDAAEKALAGVGKWLERRGVKGMAYQLTTLRDIVSATLDSGRQTAIKNGRKGGTMNQESLFNSTGPVPAQASTAPESAQVLASKRGRIKALALQYLSQAPGGLSDEEITDRIRALGVYCRHTSTVSARNALCEMKLVEDSGLRRLSPTSGFRVTVWRCTK